MSKTIPLNREEDDKFGQLVIYPQRKWHHNGYIVGNRKGLEALSLSVVRHDEACY